jgi:hypothetical protein
MIVNDDRLIRSKRWRGSQSRDTLNIAMSRSGLGTKNDCDGEAQQQLYEIERKSKAIPLTGRGRLWGCVMLRIPHCLENRLTVNCEILATCSSTYSPVRTSQEAHFVSIK